MSRAPRAVNGSVYFIIGEGSDLVKIGYSVAPTLRLKTLQAGCPVALRLLATVEGPIEEESRLKRLFHEHRAHGEWFRPTPALLEIIDAAARNEDP